MPRARIQAIEIDLTVKTKADGEEKMRLLKKNADEISMSLDEIDAEMDEVSRAADEEDEDEASDEEDEDVEDKVARHKAKWQKRMNKYRKYADKGKIEKLQKANAKQNAKLQKAKDNGKPEAYIAYKQAKCDFTQSLMKTAQLVNNLQKAGLA